MRFFNARAFKRSCRKGLRDNSAKLSSSLMPRTAFFRQITCEMDVHFSRASSSWVGISVASSESAPVNNMASS